MAIHTLPSAEELRNILYYDPETGIFLWRIKKGRSTPGCAAGNVRPDNYCIIKIAGKKYFAHRLAWKIYTGTDPVNNIDHINGRPSDNRISNLREATASQNQHNIPAQRNNTSGVKGVSRHKLSGKWLAQICKNGKTINLGIFPTISAATVAHRAAAALLHGQFMNLNTRENNNV